ncbi:DUF881 domain-containing protein [Alloscardovia criceti]|uniref:DUF881 domain-containing protein n=1 Tax=Alloscardovia criceti TaxID=356828 RepID=UPI00035D679A|nr:DUF881 domain-containing protein [Alloscardovia criceti]
MPNSSAIPSIIPPRKDEEVIRTRSAFSSEAGKLGKHRIDNDPHSQNHDVRALHRSADKSSSQLLDDLMRHPLDPMFEDSTLTAHTITKTQKIITQIISFILCVIVGIAGTQVVRSLQGASREKVRLELATQLSASSQQAQDLEAQINQQRSELNELTKQTTGEQQTIQKIQATTISTAQSAVQGDGAMITITNPSSSSSNDTTGRVTDGQDDNYVTDAQLQYVVSLLWAGGAEAISINELRLGPQTSIRAAGETILIGVTGIQSPYVIRAIGDYSQLEGTAKSKAVELFKELGISTSFVRGSNMQLPAASTASLTHARKGSE